MRLCNFDELPDGASRGFDPRGTGRDTMFVVRQSRELHAWLNACPHHGTTMPWRRHAYLNAAGDRIVCSAHGALFEIDTGRCTLGPCLGQALTPVPVIVHDGEVHLTETSRLEGKTILIAAVAAPCISCRPQVNAAHSSKETRS